jgi:hypothetical protein
MKHGQLNLFETQEHLEPDTFINGSSYDGDTNYYTWKQLYPDPPVGKTAVKRLVLCDPVEDGWLLVEDNVVDLNANVHDLRPTNDAA